MKDGRDLATTNYIFSDEEYNPQQEPSLKEKITDKIVGEIYDTKNIEVKTELNDKQVMLFARADIFAKRYKTPVLRQFTNSFMKKNLSRKRASRKEMVDVVKNVDSGVGSEREDNLISRLRGF